MQASSFCIVFSLLPLTQILLPQSHYSLLCSVPRRGRGRGGGPLWIAALATGRIWPMRATGRKLEGSGEVRSGYFFPTPFLLPCAVFDCGWVPSWLHLLPGRPFATDSSSHQALVTQFLSLFPGVVMAYCCGQFRAFSPSLVCSLSQTIIL